MSKKSSKDEGEWEDKKGYDGKMEEKCQLKVRIEPGKFKYSNLRVFPKLIYIFSAMPGKL